MDSPLIVPIRNVNAAVNVLALMYRSFGPMAFTKELGDLPACELTVFPCLRFRPLCFAPVRTNSIGLVAALVFLLTFIGKDFRRLLA